MATLAVKKTNIFPMKIKLTAHGYIREAEKLYPKLNGSFCNIPEAINNICLLFYYLFAAWDLAKCGSSLKDTVTVRKSDMAGTVYHCQWYSSQLKGNVMFHIRMINLICYGNYLIANSSQSMRMDLGSM